MQLAHFDRRCSLHEHMSADVHGDVHGSREARRPDKRPCDAGDAALMLGHEKPTNIFFVAYKVPHGYQGSTPSHIFLPHLPCSFSLQDAH